MPSSQYLHFVLMGIIWVLVSCTQSASFQDHSKQKNQLAEEANSSPSLQPWPEAATEPPQATSLRAEPFADFTGLWFNVKKPDSDIISIESETDLESLKISTYVNNFNFYPYTGEVTIANHLTDRLQLNALPKTPSSTIDTKSNAAAEYLIPNSKSRIKLTFQLASSSQLMVKLVEGEKTLDEFIFQRPLDVTEEDQTYQNYRRTLENRTLQFVESTVDSGASDCHHDISIEDLQKNIESFNNQCVLAAINDGYDYQKSELLRQTVKARNLPLLRELLRMGVNPNGTTNNGYHLEPNTHTALDVTFDMSEWSTIRSLQPDNRKSKKVVNLDILIPPMRLMLVKAGGKIFPTELNASETPGPNQSLMAKTLESGDRHLLKYILRQATNGQSSLTDDDKNQSIRLLLKEFSSRWGSDGLEFLQNFISLGVSTANIEPLAVSQCNLAIIQNLEKAGVDFSSPQLKPVLLDVLTNELSVLARRRQMSSNSDYHRQLDLRQSEIDCGRVLNYINDHH